MIKPWLYLPSQLSKSLASRALGLYPKPPRPASEYVWSSVNWEGLCFHNPLGIAGGLDKNARHMLTFQKLGCGFLEVGTITPEKQEPLSGKNFARFNSNQVLWNRLGFPNDGAEKIQRRIQRALSKIKIPLFINLGKARSTPFNKAHKDYLKIMEHFEEIGDVYVINISSPNTEGLRDLQKKDHLRNFLFPLYHKCRSQGKKMIVKISPDLTKNQLFATLEQSLQLTDGFIMGNTSQTRMPAYSPLYRKGGVSGAHLTDYSRSKLGFVLEYLKEQGQDTEKKLVVSCGGVLSYEEIQKRLDMGADLVQVYSALVFHGPWFFYRCYLEAIKNPRYLQKKQKKNRKKHLNEIEAPSSFLQS